MRLVGLLVATVFAIILSLTQNNKDDPPAVDNSTASSQMIDEVGDVPVMPADEAGTQP